MRILENLRTIQQKIERSAERAGRSPSEVTVVLVTKNVPPERIREAFDAGSRDFGENRVQEFLTKKAALPSEIRWHFVGHLQTNKVKSLLGEMELLHSLDRLALAEEIEKQAEKRSLEVKALVQVNTSGEATKSGFAPEEVEAAFQKLCALPRIKLQGLMTIGPLTDQPEAIRASFRKLRALRNQLQEKFPSVQLSHLSMGMSGDYEIAVEEGATLLRIGTAVFGERSQ